MTLEMLSRHEFFRTQDLEHIFDNLTNVITREPFFAYLDYLIKQGQKFLFGLIDIDNFKEINDTFGHLMGDKVLETFANELSTALGEKAIIGRFGGDEFMFAIENVSEYDEVWKIAHDAAVYMRREVKYPTNGQITYTAGLTRHPTDGVKFEELFEKTDKALYRGKIKGRNCFIIYLPEKHAKIDINKSRMVDKAYVEVNQTVANLIFNKNDANTAINNAIKYLADVLNVEHICIEGKTAMHFSYVHKLSNIKEFKHIPISNLNQAAGAHGILYASQRNVVKQLSESLHYNLIDQNVNSIVIAKIQAYDKFYGYVRCDMTSIARVWQLQDIDVITNLARCVALRLYLDEKLLSKENNNN